MQMNPGETTPVGVPKKPTLPLAGMRVLVIDDSDHIRLFMRTVLDHKGATVTELAGGEGAATLCEESGFDVVIVDIHMPTMDGYETFKQIRSKGLSTPVIAFSADCQDRIASEGSQFNGFLPKPVVPDELVAELLRICPFEN